MDKWYCNWQKKEAEIQSYFSNETEVHVAQEQDKLDSLIKTFKLQSSEDSSEENVNSSLRENKNMYRLFIMDDVSGVADISKNFANFLQENMVIIVFHVIVPSSQIWQKIISQTNNFNIFPASVPCNTVSKIIQSNYS